MRMTDESPAYTTWFSSGQFRQVQSFQDLHITYRWDCRSESRSGSDNVSGVAIDGLGSRYFCSLQARATTKTEIPDIESTWLSSREWLRRKVFILHDLDTITKVIILSHSLVDRREGTTPILPENGAHIQSRILSGSSFLFEHFENLRTLSSNYHAEKHSPEVRFYLN